MSTPKQQKRITVGLPARPFLYTLDQICAVTSIDTGALERTYLYFEGRSIGIKDRHQMSARNIAPDDQKPDWRVTEIEFIRWLKRMGWTYYDRGYVVD